MATAKDAKTTETVPFAPKRAWATRSPAEVFLRTAVVANPVTIEAMPPPR